MFLVMLQLLPTTKMTLLSKTVFVDYHLEVSVVVVVVAVAALFVAVHYYCNLYYQYLIVLLPNY